MRGRHFFIGAALGMVILLSSYVSEIRLPNRKGEGGRERVAILGYSIYERPIASADVPYLSALRVTAVVVAAIGLGSAATGLAFMSLGSREKPEAVVAEDDVSTGQ